MLKGEDLVGGEKSHSQVVFGQDDDVEARWWEVVLGQEDDVEDGDEWEEEKEEEGWISLLAAAAEEEVAEWERPPVVDCHLNQEYLSGSHLSLRYIYLSLPCGICL